jgi:hypothetical protein
MKKIITLLLFFLTIYTSNAQSEIKGTITYYFNKYQGDKPDIGAKIHIIDSLTFAKLDNYKTILNYNSYYTKRYLAISYSNDIYELQNTKEYLKLIKEKTKIENKKKPLKEKYQLKLIDLNNKLKPFEEQIKKKEKDFKYYSKDLLSENLISEEGWNKFCAKTIGPLTRIDLNLDKKIKSTTINGIGTYEIKNIPNGTYYILIKSNNRNGTDLATGLGKIQLKKINLNNTIKEISHNFSL